MRVDNKVKKKKSLACSNSTFNTHLLLNAYLGELHFCGRRVLLVLFFPFLSFLALKKRLSPGKVWISRCLFFNILSYWFSKYQAYEPGFYLRIFFKKSRECWIIFNLAIIKENNRYKKKILRSTTTFYGSSHVPCPVLPPCFMKIHAVDLFIYLIFA